MNRALLASLIVASAAGLAHADALIDFSVTDGGFTTSNSGVTAQSWNWGTSPAAPGGVNAWSVGQQSFVGSAWLTSPVMTVDGAGTVTGAFSHRFAFEYLFDGGQVQYTTNGGANWNTVSASLMTIWTYNATISPNFSSPIAGQQAFNGTSLGYGTPAYLTTAFTLGTGVSPFAVGSPAVFSGGESIQFRFSAHWDVSALGLVPNWQIGEFRIVNASIPTPGAAAMLGLGGLASLRRRR